MTETKRVRLINGDIMRAIAAEADGDCEAIWADLKKKRIPVYLNGKREKVGSAEDFKEAQNSITVLVTIRKGLEDCFFSIDSLGDEYFLVAIPLK